ncbi:MAG: SLC13 family permease [Bacteroidaceae bacterium]|nr:SLC13/DASS family transporter [Candidatus Minthousia equi]MCQ2246147.1 SLC13 family permease [Bacteroidaceae bacterium]
MFKSFIGYHLEAERRKAKYALRAATANTRLLKLLFCVIILLVLWNIPSTAFGIDGLTVVEQRVIAVFCFSTLMWILEAIPAWNTSVAAIVILLFCVSDSGLWCMTGNLPEEQMSQLISYKKILACFADPIIMLFIGGFILAIAATKSGLDVKLARVMLKPFGTKSENVLLGFLLVTGLFSMFLSNTATAAMMLTFLAPVLKSLPANGKGKVCLALAIPIGANIGGIGTPIGTPPNAIALKFLNDPSGLDLNIGFGQWMMIMFPFALLLLFIAWIVLQRLFPFTQKKIELNIEETEEKKLSPWQNWVVYITFMVTILLWMTDKFSGVNSNVVAMLPVGVFSVAGIITRTDLEEINWSVLWMVAGGFALGLALQDTGLAKHLIETIPFNTWSPILMIVGSGLLCYAMANFISHTATANLLVPILAMAGMSAAANLATFGGVSTLLIGVALGSSLAMVLPISTPPNALAHATGLIEQKQMVKVGLIMGIIGLTLGYIMLIFVGKAGIL